MRQHSPEPEGCTKDMDLHGHPRFARTHHLTGHEGAVFALAPGLVPGTILSGGGDGWIVQWSLAEPDPGRLIARAGARIFALASREGVLLAGDIHGGVHWIDPEAPDRNRHVAVHRKGTFALALAPEQVFSAGGDGRVTRWDPASRRPVESLQVSDRSVRCLALHSSSHLLAAGCSDGSICLIDRADMQLVHRIGEAHLPSVFCLAWSATGDRLWSGGRDARIRCWDPDGQPAGGPEDAAHWFTVNSLALSPDGRYLASASRDKRIRIWDADRLELVQSLDPVRDQGHRHSVNALLWTGGPGILVSASDDRTLGLWAQATR